MKLVYITPKAFLPESSGGAQLSTFYLLKSLQDLGWEVEVLCGTSLFSTHFREHLARPKIPSLSLQDNIIGLKCKRHAISSLPLVARVTNKSWSGWIEQQLQSLKPDIVLGDFLASDPIFKRAISLGIPSIKFVRSIPIVWVPSIIPPELHFMANSPYSASVVRAVADKNSEVIVPFVDVEQYRVDRGSQGKITFINPTPQKGVNIAVDIARMMPDQEFLFVLGRWSGFGQRRIDNLVKQARELPNVEIIQNQEDMRSVYSRTKVLLVPSQFIETFGRVIIEAQSSGIPVVASKIGGIPYALGEGGILVSPVNDTSAFVDALTTLLQDDDIYEKYSVLAKENASRPELCPKEQVNKFLQYVNDNIYPDVR